MLHICQILKSIFNFFIPVEETTVSTALRSFSIKELLEHAHREWLAAQSLFAENNDPDMIDFTIFNLIAAEKKYSYLLKKARDEQQSLSAGEGLPAGCLTDYHAQCG